MRTVLAYAACLAIAVGAAVWVGRPRRERPASAAPGGWLPLDAPLGKVLE